MHNREISAMERGQIYAMMSGAWFGTAGEKVAQIFLNKKGEVEK